MIKLDQHTQEEEHGGLLVALDLEVCLDRPDLPVSPVTKDLEVMLVNLDLREHQVPVGSPDHLAHQAQREMKVCLEILDLQDLLDLQVKVDVQVSVD